MPIQGNFLELVSVLQQRSVDKTPFVIAISGFGGSGKSTMSLRLAKALDNAMIIPIDEFITNHLSDRSTDWDGFDWTRLTTQVLRSLQEGKEVIQYGVYDWMENKITQERTVQVGQFVIVEGVGLLRQSLQNYFDFSIWIDVPLPIAYERGKRRDREEYKVDHDALWDILWMPNDKDYFNKYRPKELADFVLQTDTIEKLP